MHWKPKHSKLKYLSANSPIQFKLRCIEWFVLLFFWFVSQIRIKSVSINEFSRRMEILTGTEMKWRKQSAKSHLAAVIKYSRDFFHSFLAVFFFSYQKKKNRKDLCVKNDTNIRNKWINNKHTHTQNYQSLGWTALVSNAKWWHIKWISLPCNYDESSLISTFLFSIDGLLQIRI